VAAEAGLGRRINMVMQAAFFALSGVVPMDKVWGRGGGLFQSIREQADGGAWLLHWLPAQSP
jgi:hypothetical protein